MTFRAAGATDVGSQRVVNEDRFLVDADRGIFVVVDGVGGQAAGGRAADTALEVVRARLTSGNGSAAARLRDAITTANNEVHRQASSRAEWHGMACVLTAAMIDGDRAVVGHVGDTRLYKLRGGRIEKLTHDHSPVGEREDAGEISEADAMNHPRRNEVYRDVGSEPHDSSDPEFVDLRETPLEADAALLLCSDGLTDLVPSAAIQRIVADRAGQPEAVARALVKAANDAGGKDNITVIYVEGERFRAGAKRASGSSSRSAFALLGVLAAVLAIGVAWRATGNRLTDVISSAFGTPQATSGVTTVRPGASIAAAIAAAPPGATIVVEPGEYRERLTLKAGMRLISRVPRGATLRLPGAATDDEAAVVIADAAGAELAGFRIVGDAATSLGIGILARSSQVRLTDLEIIGAARSAIDFGTGASGVVLGSDVHDNPGTGLTIRAGAAAQISHNTFGANGASTQAAGPLLVETGATPTFTNNVFRNMDPQAFAHLDIALRNQLKSANWFPDARPAARGRGAAPTATPPAGRGRQ